MTLIGLQLGALFGGAVVVEQIFGLPGMGWLLLNSIGSRDYPVVQGAVLVFAASFVFVNQRSTSRMPISTHAYGSGSGGRPVMAQAISLRTTESVPLAFARRLIGTPGGLTGATIVLVVIAVSVLAPLLAPYPLDELVGKRYEPPPPMHLLGTDELGRDVLSRLLYGGRPSLFVGLVASISAATVGTAIGLMTGSRGGLADDLSMRLVDVLLSFPTLILILAFVSVLGASLLSATVAIGIVSCARFARVVRAPVLSLVQQEFITAARVVGAREVRIVVRHLLPNVLAPISVLQRPPTIDEVMRANLSYEQVPDLGRAEIGIARSTDHGDTWSGTIIPGSAGGDKTSVAVDTRDDSPHRGNIYVAWNMTADGQVAFSRSLDGGRTAEPAIRIAGRSGYTPTQIAVGPRGVVHLVWHLALWMSPNADDLSAGSAIFHARSTDGGATFSEPRVIARHGAIDPTGALDRMGNASLAIGRDGAMLAAWSEADAPQAERGAQVRNQVYWIITRDGETWTSPARLSQLAPDVSQGLPAVARTQDAWHVLTYEASHERTTVRIHSMRDRDRMFRPTCDLATRNFGSYRIYLKGSYQLKRSSEIALIGDYVGLAGAGRSLAAAIVLPETDDWRSTNTAYASILEDVSD